VNANFSLFEQLLSLNSPSVSMLLRLDTYHQVDATILKIKIVTNTSRIC